MPPRSAPTARQARLGTELRRMRERAGITARGAAAILGSNPMQMSHVESGKSGISEARIRRLAAECACDDAAYVDALVAMATVRERGWWEEYRGDVASAGLDVAELEYYAVRLSNFQVTHIPGLFQTERHMRAAFRYASPEWPESAQDIHVSFRARRQEIITAQPGTSMDAVIHESALRIRVGGRQTAREQLERILDLSSAPNVNVRVIPFENEDFAGVGYSMHYAHATVPQLDTVQIDTEHGGLFIDAESRLRQYASRYQKIRKTSLPETESRDLINRIKKEM